MDIQEVAKSFQRLFDIRYDFLLGRKGKTIEFSIIFRDCDFHHLAGLHYLADVNTLKRSRSNVFWDIFNGVIANIEIVSSDTYSVIIDRLNTLNQIENLIDTDKIIFKYSLKISCAFC